MDTEKANIKDIRLIARIKNNILFTEREKLGFTLRQMGEFCKISLTAYMNFENFNTSPIAKNGDWGETATKIAHSIGIPREEVWPDSLLKITKNAVFVEFSSEDLLQSLVPSQDDICHQLEMRNRVRQALNTLTPREQAVIEMRCGLDTRDGTIKTLESVGKSFGLNGETIGGQRVGAIEAKALRKLRHPSRSKKLRKYTADYIIDIKTKKEIEAEDLEIEKINREKKESREIKERKKARMAQAYFPYISRKSELSGRYEYIVENWCHVFTVFNGEFFHKIYLVDCNQYRWKMQEWKDNGKQYSFKDAIHMILGMAIPEGYVA